MGTKWKNPSQMDHPETGTRCNNRPYSIWCNMMTRCYNSNHIRYSRYGGRGIKVCDKWQSYDNFYEDNMPIPEGLTLERIDSDKGYALSNCKWASYKEQSNNRDYGRYFTHDGRTMRLTEWVEETGLPRKVIQQRIDYCGWSVEKALTTPKREQ